METNSNDKRLEILLRELVSSAAADESTIDEVMATPTVWWGIQRQIHEQKADPRLSLAKIRRWLLIGAPAAVAAALLIALFISQATVSPIFEPISDRAGLVQPEHVVTPESSLSEPEPELPTVKITEVARKRSVRSLGLKTRPAKTRSRVPKGWNAPASEIRSEFIALSYARDPESGQIVRVKVPRSMMVTVGLLASVDKPATLVEAEVLLGDDGMTRAIRFIR